MSTTDPDRSPSGLILGPLGPVATRMRCPVTEHDYILSVEDPRPPYIRPCSMHDLKASTDAIIAASQAELKKACDTVRKIAAAPRLPNAPRNPLSPLPYVILGRITGITESPASPGWARITVSHGKGTPEIEQRVPMDVAVTLRIGDPLTITLA